MLKIQNEYLNDVAIFIRDSLVAKGKRNIDRMRVVKALQARADEVAQEEYELLKEYAILEDGEPKMDKDGNFDLSDIKGFREQQKELFRDYYIIDDKNLEKPLEYIGKLLLNYDGEVAGISAEMHYLLVEAFDEAGLLRDDSQEEI